ncbi:MAG TPA: hypothetical protein VFV43_09155 [Limnobacter sp.]|nr:hypothetical protein [Limnobacter sp.]
MTKDQALKEGFTHKGWFGLCPVYVGDINSEAPLLSARWDCVEWLMDLSEAVFSVTMPIHHWLTGNEPMWPIRITGIIKP